MSAAPWTDSHCHLHDLDAPMPVLERALAAGVGRVVCVGTGLSSSRGASELARAASRAPGSPLAWSTVGLHPHDAKAGLEPVAELLEALLAEESSGEPGPRLPGTVVGVGECGLDYHYDHSPRDVQRDVFAAQVALACRYDLTLVVHTRDAWDDTFDVLAAAPMPERTVIHCFTGGPDDARRCLDVGAYLSFSGIVTFPKAPEVREAAILCPLDRMLVETDAPFLAPVPHRGSPNEPAYVPISGARLAELKGIDAVDLAETTSANAQAAFALVVPTGS